MIRIFKCLVALVLGESRIQKHGAINSQKMQDGFGLTPYRNKTECSSE